MNEWPTEPLGRPLRLVLLIEDTPRDSALIQDQFREAGAACTFTVHRRLSDALSALRAGATFDLILLDLGLPDNSGLDALHAVRAAAPRTPTIVLTGRADGQLASEALQSGAQDYLVKGQHDPQMLLRAARHAIDRTETVELRETERLKSELLSIVSHEMRTPLTVIRENISLILEGALGSVTSGQREFIVSAVANCDRLRTMIDDLVDTAAIERGALTLLRRPFNLVSLLDVLVREYRAVLSSRQQTLMVELPQFDTIIPIFGDTDRIRQALTNLLGNAHKYGRVGGNITLRVRLLEKEVLIEVTDTGVGIAKEALGHIFERFVQLGRVHGPGLKGAGLGLSIVRHIVERHGGSIGVESEPGRGSTFTVRLPLFVEGEELSVLLHGRGSSPNDGEQHALVVVRLRPDLSTDRAIVVLRRLTELLRTQLRGVYDEALLLEQERVVVLAITGLDGSAPWLQDRLAGMLSEDAASLEWALCPMTDIISARLPANLRFESVLKG
jgi:signal transduction histidine kinase